ATAVAASKFRSLTTTRPPAAASPRASARPIPAPAPVTTTPAPSTVSIVTSAGYRDRCPPSPVGARGRAVKGYCWRRWFRPPLGPRTELQAHRLHGCDRRRVFPARSERTPGAREGLPCPVGRVHCPPSPACGTCDSRRN